MTAEQVDAFIAKMDGFLLISGAPGTGKTTIALQRVRFLLDQQSENRRSAAVKHSIASTRVFLASDKLQDYVTELLESELELPASIISITPDYIARYVSEKWGRKNGATLRRREISELERLRREACFNLCSVAVLKEIWEAYELQIKERPLTSSRSKWNRIVTDAVSHSAEERYLTELHKHFSVDVKVVDDPRDSGLRMEPLFGRVRRAYHGCRDGLRRDDNRSDETQQRFDTASARGCLGLRPTGSSRTNISRESRRRDTQDGVGDRRPRGSVGDRREHRSRPDTIRRIGPRPYVRTRGAFLDRVAAAFRASGGDGFERALSRRRRRHAAPRR